MCLSFHEADDPGPAVHHHWLKPIGFCCLRFLTTVFHGIYSFAFASKIAFLFQCSDYTTGLQPVKLPTKFLRTATKKPLAELRPGAAFLS
jgi:hypothetical protein